MENTLQIIETNGIQTVSARELYKGLEIKWRFSQWWENNSKDFEEGIDFTSVGLNTVVNNGATREIQDYAISIDMAKAICLMSRTEIGKKYRTYLINLEKAWNNPEMVMKRALEYANKRAEQLYLECQIMQPKADYYDNFADSTSLIEIGHLGKKSGIGSKNIFPLMVGKKIIYKKYVDGIEYYEPYKQYEKYFASVEKPFIKPDGTKKSRPTLYLTSKGFEYFLPKLSVIVKETAEKLIEPSYTYEQLSELTGLSVDRIKDIYKIQNFLDEDGKPIYEAIHMEKLFTEDGKLTEKARREVETIAGFYKGARG